MDSRHTYVDLNCGSLARARIHARLHVCTCALARACTCKLRYVKLDWLAWGATMADTEADFHAMMGPIWSQADETSCRVPLTDLFDTISATCAYGKKAFVARPVVGGVYAKMLAPGAYPF